jgi:hypothetical protein
MRSNNLYQTKNIWRISPFAKYFTSFLQLILTNVVFELPLNLQKVFYLQYYRFFLASNHNFCSKKSIVNTPCFRKKSNPKTPS